MLARVGKLAIWSLNDNTRQLISGLEKISGTLMKLYCMCYIKETVERDGGGLMPAQNQAGGQIGDFGMSKWPRIQEIEKFKNYQV